MKQKENVKEEVKEEAGEKQQKNNFAQGSIVVNILKLAVPMTLAQLINVLYNIVDRLYIGQLKDEATISLTGLGLCLPIISIVIAFANLLEWAVPHCVPLKEDGETMKRQKPLWEIPLL